MKRYNISRTQFFDVAAKFTFINERLSYAGALYIEGWLTPEEADEINAAFPCAVWL